MRGESSCPRQDLLHDKGFVGIEWNIFIGIVTIRSRLDKNVISDLQSKQWRKLKLKCLNKMCIYEKWNCFGSVPVCNIIFGFTWRQ